MIITNSRYAVVGYFITSYPTRAHGIIVIYLCTCHWKPPLPPPPPRGDVGHTWGFASAWTTYRSPGGGGIFTLDNLYFRRGLDFSPNHMVDYSKWRVLKVSYKNDSSEIKVAMNFLKLSLNVLYQALFRRKKTKMIGQ